MTRKRNQPFVNVKEFLSLSKALPNPGENLMTKSYIMYLYVNMGGNSTREYLGILDFQKR